MKESSFENQPEEIGKNEKIDLPFFHDQKNNDFNPETGITYGYEGAAKNEENQIFNEGEDRRREIGSSEELKEIITQSVSLIDSLKLEDAFKDDAKQIELLEKKKSMAKNLIFDVLNQIPRYLESIRITKDSVRENTEEYSFGKSSQRSLDASQMRKRSHDVLIEKINIAKRYIENNFGQIEAERIKAWEDSEKAAGRDFPCVKRVKFSRNIICPDYLKIEKNVTAREGVAKWALQVYDVLSQIETKREP